MKRQDNKRNKPVFKNNVPNDQFKFLPPPAPTGKYPYHLSLAALQPGKSTEKMVFHMVGDTGSAKQPEFQGLVAAEMISHFNTSTPEDQPLFLYHLGDVVYHFGEAEEYYRQFFEPYKNYPRPIFAIAGNHDSDINPHARVTYKSLDAFVHVFCDTESRPTKLSQNTSRKTMVQPNIYWTLETPLATIIGLYSNVPKFGAVHPEQKDWFINELKSYGTSGENKALIVCIHHAPFSADTNHGASRPMIEFLEDSYKHADVRPDIVFSGHVHNYQRFSKTYPNEKTIPYIVAGAGGYATLFPIAAIDEPGFTDADPLLENVHLDKFCDFKHGFLKISLEKAAKGLMLTGEYFTIPHTIKNGEKIPVKLYDRFTLNINK